MFARAIAKILAMGAGTVQCQSGENWAREAGWCAQHSRGAKSLRVCYGNV